MDPNEQSPAGEGQEQIIDQGEGGNAEALDGGQQAASPQVPEKKQVTLPSDAVAKIRQEERAKGERAALAKLDENARKLGFRNHQDMVRAAQRAKRSAACVRLRALIAIGGWAWSQAVRWRWGEAALA